MPRTRRDVWKLGSDWNDTILWYAKGERWTFERDAIDRIPYLAPDLVGPEKAARGKLPTDVWWHTIVSPTGKEKTGYPTQKPEGVVRRIVQASSRPGDWCLDPFAGSGTLGSVCGRLGRRFVLIDSSAEAVEVARARAERFCRSGPGVPAVQGRKSTRAGKR